MLAEPMTWVTSNLSPFIGAAKIADNSRYGGYGRLNMGMLKIIGRVLLAIFILLLLVQIILTGIAILTMGAEKAEVMSYLIGRIVGAVIFLILAVLGFKKLGKSNPA